MSHQLEALFNMLLAQSQTVRILGDPFVFQPFFLIDFRMGLHFP
jgi:hypothetical protein